MVVRRRWEQSEIDYIEKYHGRLSNAMLAKKLNRTQRAVALQINRMGLGRKIYYDGYYTLVQIYAAFHHGYSPHKRTVDKWRASWEAEGVVTKKVRISSAFPDKVTELIDIDEFWKWAKKHLDYVNVGELEESALGIEPEWVRQERMSLWEKRRQKRWNIS